MREAKGELSFDVIELMARIFNAESEAEIAVIKDEFMNTLQLEEVKEEQLFDDLLNIIIDYGIYIDMLADCKTQEELTQVRETIVVNISAEIGVDKASNALTVLEQIAEQVKESKQHTEVGTQENVPNTISNHSPEIAIGGFAISSLIVFLAFKQKYLKRKNKLKNVEEEVKFRK